MTDPQLDRIANFLSQELAIGLGNIRMALFWIDQDSAARDPGRLAAGLRRLDGELGRLESRATDLCRDLRGDPAEGPPEPAATAAPESSAPDLPAADPEAGSENVLTAVEPDLNTATRKADTCAAETEFGDPFPDAAPAAMVDPAPELAAEPTVDDTSAPPADPDAELADAIADQTAPGQPSRRETGPRTGLPPAGLLTPDATGAPDLTGDPAGPEAPAEQTAADTDAAAQDATEGEPDDTSPRDHLAGPRPAEAPAESDLGASIDALLDAAEAARGRSANGEPDLDLDTLERLLGEVRAAFPEEAPAFVRAPGQGAGASRDSAQSAASATTGSGSPASGASAGFSAAAPELPIA